MKKFFNKRAVILLTAILAVVAFFSFKSSDSRTFQLAKNMEIFNAIVKELDMFYVDTIDPNKTLREGIDAMLMSLDPYTNYFPEEDQSEQEQSEFQDRSYGIPQGYALKWAFPLSREIAWEQPLSCVRPFRLQL
jgi:hypothetical protein